MSEKDMRRFLLPNEARLGMVFWIILECFEEAQVETEGLWIWDGMSASKILELWRHLLMSNARS